MGMNYFVCTLRLMRCQLYSRETKLASEGESPQGATIKIPLHEPGTVPEKIDFMRFLATSITFMAHLETVEVFLDGDCFGCINKTTGRTEAIDSPISLPHASPSGMMTVRRLRRHRRYHLNCEVHNSTLVLIRVHDPSQNLDRDLEIDIDRSTGISQAE